MRNTICFYIVVYVLINILCSCTLRNESSNRVYFSIDPEDRKIVVPVQINDSITARLAFDTGWGLGASHIFLDSDILSAYPELSSEIVPDSTEVGSTWETSKESGLIYNSNPRMKIGDVNLAYDGIYVMDWKKHMNSNASDGIFNIPKNDTTHIWELNFENSYIQIHSANSFTIPENCLKISLIGPDYEPFFINLPLHMKFADNDSLSINSTFFIDLGMPWDIVLMHTAKELDFLNKRKDAIWTKYSNNYHRYYNVNTVVFDNLSVDSLRIYTFDYPNNIKSDYLIGLNFLKRFNVFLDMKNKQIGLQPINNFQRVINPLHTRFHYSTRKTPDGKYIINKIADYKENYYKTAGLQEGDEIVKINDISYENISKEIGEEFKRQEYAIFDIVRNGKSMKISVKIDHNEQQGD